MPSPDQITLLSLCRIKGLSWYLVAREATRPGGLARLVKGEVSERKEAPEARRVLLAARSRLEDVQDEIERSVTPVLKEGIRLTTVLDEDYPLNLRTIFNRPPFLFYWGELREDDARSVAVVGTRDASVEGLRRAEKMARLLAER